MKKSRRGNRKREQVTVATLAFRIDRQSACVRMCVCSSVSASVNLALCISVLTWTILLRVVGHMLPPPSTFQHLILRARLHTPTSTCSLLSEVNSPKPR